MEPSFPALGATAGLRVGLGTIRGGRPSVSRRGLLAELGLVAALLPLLVGVLVAVLWGPLPEHRAGAQALLALAGAAWVATLVLARWVPDSRPLWIALFA